MMLHEFEMKAVYADTLIELMKSNPNVVCLEADLGKSSGTYPKVKDAFPDNFFDIGVAEGNMMGIAAGLANEGRVPFAASFTPFATRRPYDIVTVSIALSKNNVKIVGTAPGVTTTMNGATHMCFEDLAIMRAMPNIHIYCPADAYELKSALIYMANEKQPTYLQLLREKWAQIPGDYAFNPSKARIITQGKDLTLVTTSLTTQYGLKAVESLKADGISVEHIHYPSVKPFDGETLINSVKKTGKVITVENQNIIGGLGSAVCEVLSESYPVRVKRLGARDRFGEVGELAYLSEQIGIDPKTIVQECKIFMKS